MIPGAPFMVGDRVVVGSLGNEWIPREGWQPKIGSVRAQGLITGIYRNRVGKWAISVAVRGKVRNVEEGDVALFIGPTRPGEPLFKGGGMVMHPADAKRYEDGGEA